MYFYGLIYARSVIGVFCRATFEAYLNNCEICGLWIKMGLFVKCDHQISAVSRFLCKIALWAKNGFTTRNWRNLIKARERKF